MEKTWAVHPTSSFPIVLIALQHHPASYLDIPLLDGMYRVALLLVLLNT
jgi:hypothetical protein